MKMPKLPIDNAYDFRIINGNDIHYQLRVREINNV
jgi:hypothetical protein